MKPQNRKEKRQHCHRYHCVSTSVRGETSGAEFWCKSFPEWMGNPPLLLFLQCSTRHCSKLFSASWPDCLENPQAQGRPGGLKLQSNPIMKVIGLPELCLWLLLTPQPFLKEVWDYQGFLKANLLSWSQEGTSCVFHPLNPFPHPLPFLL